MAQGFRESVEGFLLHYLGTPSSPVPFGGRGRELAALNAWLHDAPTEPVAGLISGPADAHSLLITAPAGRGKTALLVRWIQQIEPGLEVVFVPVSIRAETNLPSIFYQALAARLAEIVGDTLAESQTDPAPYYREKAIEYLKRVEASGIPTLVVIDGLDEARGWKFDTNVLPPRPGPSLRIVISARELAGDAGPANWLERIGWSSAQSGACTLAVPPLDREGIADVLARMEFPVAPLSKNVDVIAELHRLTEGGDPVLLQYYANDLRRQGEAAARFRPEDLRDLKPGFGEYFRGWMRQQEDEWEKAGERLDAELVDAILAVLAVAHGPLKMRVIEEVVRRLDVGPKIFSRRLISPLRRFLIGDGVGVGYVLSHPKLAQFLREEHFGGGGALRATSDALAAWAVDVARELNRGTLAVGDVPEYALIYATQHFATLERDRSLAAFRELIEDGWRRAWEAYEHGYQGFSRDVELALRAFRRAAEADPKLLRAERVGLGGQIRSALCLSSIRGIGLGVPSSALVAFLRNGDLTPKQALYLVLFKPEGQLAEVLGEILPLLPDELRLEAHAAARDVVDPLSRLKAMLVTAAALPPGDQMRAYEACARTYYQVPEHRRPEVALEALRSHVPAAVLERMKEDRARVLAMAEAEAEARAAREASERRRVARRSSPDAAAFEPSSPAWEEPAPGGADREEEPPGIDQLVASASSGDRSAAEALIEAASRMDLAGQADLLRRLDRPMGYSTDKSLAALADELDPSLQPLFFQLIFRRVTLASPGESWRQALPEVRAKVLANVLGEAERSGQDAGLDGVLRAMPEGELTLEDRLRALRVRTNIDSYKLERVWEAAISRAPEAVLREAFDIAANERDSDRRSRCLAELAPTLPEDLLRPCVDLAKALTTIEERGRVLAILLPRLQQAGLRAAISDAYRAAFVIGDADVRGLALATVAPFLEADAQRDAARELDSVEVEIDWGANELRVVLHVLSSLWRIRRLAPERAAEDVRALLARAEEIRNPFVGVLVRALCAAQVSEDEAEEAVELVLEVARRELDLDGQDVEGSVVLRLLLALLVSRERAGPLLEEVRGLLAGVDDEEKRAAIEAAVAAASLLLAETEGAAAVESLHAILERAAGVEGDLQDAIPFLALLLSPSVPERERALLRTRALESLARVDDPVMCDLEHAALVPFLDGVDLARAVGRLLDTAARTPRPRVFGSFGLVHWGGDVLFPARPTLGGNRLPGSPIERIGGATAVRETVEAIRDVCAWWP